ncbi:MAG: hypothetical protein K8L91_13480 [Anaerolineae bacterium]|nr:hypothetical protein [Anaerolineae bacterium]
MAARLDMVYLLKYIKRELLNMLATEIDKRDTDRLASLSRTVYLLSEIADSIPDRGARIGIIDDFVNAVQHVSLADFKVILPSDDAIEEAFQ